MDTAAFLQILDTFKPSGTEPLIEKIRRLVVAEHAEVIGGSSAVPTPRLQSIYAFRAKNEASSSELRQQCQQLADAAAHFPDECWHIHIVQHEHTIMSVFSNESGVCRVCMEGVDQRGIKVSPEVVALMERLRQSQADDAISTLLEVSRQIVFFNEEQRAYVKERLIVFIERDRKSSAACKGVWTLGKFQDPALEEYLASLIATYANDEALGSHLQEVMAAIDNIEAIPGWHDAAGSNDLSAIQQIALDYVAAYDAARANRD